MGKKKKKDKKIKKETITTKSRINRYDFTNGEAFIRMNYLLRLSEIVYKSKEKINEENKKDNPNISNKVKNDEQNILSHLYLSIMKDISKRNAIRVNKYVKKVTCQKCNNLLFKDINSELKFINKNGKKTLQLKCSECGNISEIIYF